jgi:hypothetical protein
VARPKLAFTLTDEQRRELERLAKAPATPQKFVRRAQVAYLLLLMRYFLLVLILLGFLLHL